MYLTHTQKEEKKRVRRLKRRNKKKLRQRKQNQHPDAAQAIEVPEPERKTLHREIQDDHTCTIVCDGYFLERECMVGIGQLFFKKDRLVAFAYGAECVRFGTNNRAKLTALRESVLAAEKIIDGCKNRRIQIINNSDYSLCALLDAEKHSSRSWVAKNGQPLANVDLIEPMLSPYVALKDQITLTMITNEADFSGNSAARALALQALGSMRTGISYKDDLLDLARIVEDVPEELFGA